MGILRCPNVSQFYTSPRVQMDLSDSLTIQSICSNIVSVIWLRVVYDVNIETFLVFFMPRTWALSHYFKCLALSMEQAASTAGLELREPYVSSFSRQACYLLRYYKSLDMNVEIFSWSKPRTSAPSSLNITKPLSIVKDFINNVR